LAGAQAQGAALFFDLGEVIVTGNPTDGYVWVEGMQEHLAELRAQGFQVGLVSNIPEAWGETCEKKFETLQAFLESNWKDEVPFDWSILDYVVVPSHDRYRKPHPLMFLTALDQVCEEKALYMGEDPAEIERARQLGLATIRVSDLQTPLVPAVELNRRMAEEFRFAYPAGCDFAPLYERVLAPADRGLGIQACVIEP
jgi:FMN phosphatase YigB (HAD superfamily)